MLTQAESAQKGCTATNTDLQALAAGITDSLSSARASMPSWLWRHPLQLLAKGEPVTIEALSAACGHSADEIRRALAQQPDTEYDEQGSIVGHGVT